MNDNTPLGELTAADLKQIVRDVPKTYFKEACRECREECKLEWEKDINEMGEKVTGLDVSTVQAKDKIRGVYKHAEVLKSTSGTITAQFWNQAVIWVFLIVALFLGLKKG